MAVRAVRGDAAAGAAGGVSLGCHPGVRASNFRKFFLLHFFRFRHSRSWLLAALLLARFLLLSLSLFSLSLSLSC